MNGNEANVCLKKCQNIFSGKCVNVSFRYKTNSSKQ